MTRAAWATHVRQDPFLSVPVEGPTQRVKCWGSVLPLPNLFASTSPSFRPPSVSGGSSCEGLLPALGLVRSN